MEKEEDNEVNDEGTYSLVEGQSALDLSSLLS
jgi:hypothetical protein